MRKIKEALNRAGVEINEDIERELNKLNYGLYFVREDEEEIDYIIEEDKSREIKGEGVMNYLFEGDNLFLLREMKRRGEKADLIYIDPPYNVRANVIYNDNYGGHAEWLDFMEKRLILARDILDNDGLIFISIDEKEQAQLKLLMNDIFGEENFITNIHWRRTGQQQNTGKNFANIMENILVYGKELKDKDLILGDLLVKRPGIEAYNKKDERGVFRVSTIHHNSSGSKSYSVRNPKTGKVISRDRWTIDKERFMELENQGMIYWGNNFPGLKIYLKKDKRILPNNLLIGPYNETSNKEIRDVFGERVFEFSKPKELMKWIIERHPDKDIRVLDFFAGSGTTGQAVMELNREDGGSRSFILCNTNEVNNNLIFDKYNKEADDKVIVNKNGSIRKTKKNVKAYEEALKSDLYNKIYKSDEIQDEGICRKITYERIKRVNDRDGHNINMKYYIIGGVDNETN